MKDGICITQSRYLKEILKNFGMEDYGPVRTPMSIGHKISSKDDSKEVDKTTYKLMTRKLQYVVHTRLNIALAVGMVARFFANPKENHMMAIKRIMSYLKGTEEYGLWYKKGDNFELRAFTNVDWEGSVDDRKSTSGGAFFLGKRLVSWTSKK